MQIDDLKEYFDLFIINYLPHKDKDLYKQISNFLLDYYYSDTYESIPESFKSAYEQQIIPIEFYDYLLLSNGFPDYIIRKLNNDEKLILLKTFMDFNVYKGTIYSLQKVSDAFDDTFSIYELFVDKDSITNEWVFKPYLVYQNPKVTTILKENFNWEKIVNSTKHFLINKNSLDEIDLLLPIKTNLIMLDYHDIHNYSYVNSIYTATILNHFKNYNMILYLKNGEYKTNIITFYRLWYYILNKTYKIDYPEVIGNYVYFDYSLDSFPIDLVSLPIIKLEYEAITNQSSCREFEDHYFDLFKTVVNNPAINSTQLQLSYEYSIPADLFQYVNTRIADEIIDELYNSLITWFYSLTTIYDEYKYFFQIFALQLPLVRTKIEDTTTYLLIEHLKPYHVEIVLNDLTEILTINDPFNNLYIDNYIRLQYKLHNVSLAHQSHNVLLKILSQITVSSPIISSDFYMAIKLLNDLFTNIIATDIKLNLIFNSPVTFESISNNLKFKSLIKEAEQMSVINTIKSFILTDPIMMYYVISNISKYNLIFNSPVTFESISNNLKFKSLIEQIDQASITNEVSSIILDSIRLLYSIIASDIKYNLLFTSPITFESISDNLKFNLLIKQAESVSVINTIKSFILTDPIISYNTIINNSKYNLIFNSLVSFESIFDNLKFNSLIKEAESVSIIDSFTILTS